MQSLYPVEKAIRPGCPLGIGGQGQELRYVSGLYVPAHGVLADAIFPRYAAIRALPGRQQLLDSKALLVRANGTDHTQLLLLIHAAGARLLGNGCWLPLRLRLGFVRGPRQGLSLGFQGFPELVFASLAHFCYLQAFPYLHDWAVLRTDAW